MVRALPGFPTAAAPAASALPQGPEGVRLNPPGRPPAEMLLCWPACWGTCVSCCGAGAHARASFAYVMLGMKGVSASLPACRAQTCWWMRTGGSRSASCWGMSALMGGVCSDFGDAPCAPCAGLPAFWLQCSPCATDFQALCPLDSRLCLIWLPCCACHFAGQRL